MACLPPVLWAVTYTIAKPATDRFPPIFLTSILYALASIALWRPWIRLQTPFWAIIVAATLGCSLQSALIFSGIAQVPASLAILVVQSQVPFAVLAAWAIGQEQINYSRFAGIALSLMGVALVVGLPDSIGQIEGLLLIVLGTLSWGMAQGIIGTISREPGGRMMGVMSALAAPQLLALSLLLETGQRQALLEASLVDWAAVAMLAIGGFVAAYVIWYGLLRRYRVDQIAPFILIMPIFGVLSAFLLLGERPSLSVLLGGLIILGGLTIVVRAPTSRTFESSSVLPDFHRRDDEYEREPRQENDTRHNT